MSKTVSHKMFFLFLAILFPLLQSCSFLPFVPEQEGPLSGYTIAIDPGHGGSEAYDHWRVGPTGEREEWINLRVALYLHGYLEKAGARVILTRRGNRDVSLGGRASLARQADSDLFISIHHNGSSDRSMDYPLVYYWGSELENPASVQFARILVDGMAEKMTFADTGLAGVFSDHIIYDNGTSVLRNTYPQLPGVIGEGGFFTNPDGEQRMKSKSYNRLEARVYYQAILDYVSRGLPKALPVLDDSLGMTIPPDSLVTFQLTDGLGGHAFVDTSLQVQVDSIFIAGKLDAEAGTLSLKVPGTDEHRQTLRVYGRNAAGNALHPRAWNFRTQAGARYFDVEDWRTAFERGESAFDQLDSLLALDSLQRDSLEAYAAQALHFYQLSLDLQIVHLKAREAEERIAWLYRFQMDQLGDPEAGVALARQRQRIARYYP